MLFEDTVAEWVFWGWKPWLVSDWSETWLHMNGFWIHYVVDRGEFVVHEGEVGDGIYFIWEGEVSLI